MNSGELPSLSIPDLTTALDQLLRQIPHGRITTYGELARALGDVRLAAWIGGRLLDHPHAGDCACHRVVRSSGEIGRYIAGEGADKSARLAAEGIDLQAGRAVLSRCRMRADEFITDRPLHRLQQQQADLAARVRESPLEWPPRAFCGLDIAYPEPELAQGAAVLVDAATRGIIWQTVLRRPTEFPYVPGYLAFRELPLLLDLWSLACRHAPRETVALIDGQGRLHPRRAGIACCFGVLADVPTIGVGKSLLCGRVTPVSADAAAATVDDEAACASGMPPAEAAAGSSPLIVVDAAETLATALPGRRGGRPLYVSVGHRITLPESVRIVAGLRTEGRLPEPLRLADRLSRSAGECPAPSPGDPGG